MNDERGNDTKSDACCTMALAAGRATTNEELEDMLESGNPAIFTQGVNRPFFYYYCIKVNFNLCQILLFSKDQRQLLYPIKQGIFVAQW